MKKRLPGDILHAHCTSGNGMVAWMSGHPYIVTTYGSEVILAQRRGRLYQWLIHRVLRGAERITATSQHMVDVLVRDHGIDQQRIHLFDLGLNTEVFHPPTPDAIAPLRAQHGIGCQEPVWVSVKRAIPTNRTIEVVDAFAKYCEDHPQGRLVIICGDDVSAYSNQVKQYIAESSHAERIIVLDKWLTAPEVAGWLQLADFAVSVPVSDQMSNAVLEAMACASVPILLNIDGYGSLKERGANVLWLDDCQVESLVAAFQTSAGWSSTELATRQQAAASFIDEHYANRQVRELLQRLYRLPSQQDEATLHAA
jgi:glycosyltransferase involved in cell wall biosynthesis